MNNKIEKNINIKKIVGVLLGNLILGIGVALLRISGMGNDPYSACNMAISDAFGFGLGTYQLAVNLVIFIIQLIWGRKYIGFGTVINLFLLGYIVQFSLKGWEVIIGDGSGFSFFQQIIVMIIALVILSFGLSMYQVANMGVSPYDYLALGMADRFKPPYFVDRIITDAGCVLIIIISVLAGLLTWKDSHLGIATVICAFCLGPLVGVFTKLNKKWIE